MRVRPSQETLQAYRALVEAADDVVLIADWESARFIDANQVALDKLGYTLGELSEMTGGDLSQFPREQHSRLSRELTQHGETHARAVPIRLRDGSTTPMDLWVKKYVADGTAYHINVLRDCERKPVGAATFRIARGQLLASEAFYRGVVTCTEDAVLITDLDGFVCIEANPAAAKMFGYPAAEWSQIVCDRLHAPPSSPRMAGIRAQLLEDGSAKVTDTPMIRKDGSVFVADLMHNVFELEHSLLVVITIRDVTERRKQAERLQQSFAELKQAQAKVLRAQKLAVVGEVAAGVAHEINNPAAFLLMNCDALAERIEQAGNFFDEFTKHVASEKDPERKRTLSKMLERHDVDIAGLRTIVDDNLDGIERIRSVTRDLRLFSRVDSVETMETDLNALVRSTVNLLSNELHHRARVTIELDDNVPTVLAERGKLAQVVTNLLLNASQAIVEGAAESNEIEVTTRLDGDSVVLSVSDTGVGMGEETSAQIYDPFFTTKPSEQGTGLGLSLCLEIVNKHRGRIAVHSRLGEGSRFEVSIPRDTGLTLETPPVTRIAAATSGKRILVIDDNPGVVRAYRRMLSERDALVVSSGSAALSALAEDDGYDLIVCDLMMPEMDGPQVYEAIAETAPHLLSRTVFCTGGAFTPRVRKFVSCVDNPVIDKPISLAVIDGLLASQ